MKMYNNFSVETLNLQLNNYVILVPLQDIAGVHCPIVSLHMTAGGSKKYQGAGDQCTVTIECQLHTS